MILIASKISHADILSGTLSLEELSSELRSSTSKMLFAAVLFVYHGTDIKCFYFYFYYITSQSLYSITRRIRIYQG